MVVRVFLIFSDVASMVKELGKKGITVKDEPGVSLVRLFGPGVGDEKVRYDSTRTTHTTPV